MNQERLKFVEAVKRELEPNIFCHSLALEACMGGVFDYLEKQKRIDLEEESRDKWTLAGLVHDIDYARETKEDHPNKTRDVLDKYGLTICDEINQIVKAHSPKNTGVEPKTKAQWAIFCADSLTGLITAVTFVYPTRKISDVKLSSVLKRFKKEPKFAAGTRRSEVSMCGRKDGLDIELDKFIEICFEAMKGVAQEIGL